MGAHYTHHPAHTGGRIISVVVSTDSGDNDLRRCYLFFLYLAVFWIWHAHTSMKAVCREAPHSSQRGSGVWGGNSRCAMNLWCRSVLRCRCQIAMNSTRNAFRATAPAVSLSHQSRVPSSVYVRLLGPQKIATVACSGSVWHRAATTEVHVRR